jgi:hypothetical protein
MPVRLILFLLYRSISKTWNDISAGGNRQGVVQKTQGYVIHSNSSLKSHVKSKILDILLWIGYLAWHEL